LSNREKCVYAKPAEAANVLGMCYIQGCRLPKDVEKGIGLLERAVKEGSPGAMCNLGTLLMDGSDVEQNVEMGTTLMQKAATAGDTYACQWLANCGVPSTGPVAPETQAHAAAPVLKCENCGRHEPTKRCSRCKRAFYCSSRCQADAWKGGHRLQCQPPSLIERHSSPINVGNSLPCSEVRDPDISLQKASLGTAESANAALSDALLRGNPVVQQGDRSIVVLEYTRCPEVVWRVLAESPLLSEMRDRGAKLFVNPEDMTIVLEELGHQNLELKPRHVVVAAETEDLVCAVLDRAIKDTPKSQRGLCKVHRRHPVVV